MIKVLLANNHLIWKFKKSLFEILDFKYKLKFSLKKYKININN